MVQIVIGGDICGDDSLPVAGASIGYFQTIPQLRAETSQFTVPVSVYVAGNVVAGDGGGGLYTYNPSSTAPDDGVLTIEQTNDAGSGRWILQINNAVVTNLYVTPEQFGAVGDGITNDTAAVTSAIATGKSVFFAKKYGVVGSIAVVCNGQVLFGAGFASGLVTTSPTGDVLTLNGTNIEIHSLEITSGVTRSAGSFINTQSASQVFIHNCLFTYFWIGISVGISGVGATLGSNIYIEQCSIVFGYTGGVGIVVNNVAGLTLRDLNLAGQSPSLQLFSGVSVYATGDMMMDRVETLYCGYGFAATISTGNVMQAIWINKCVFDTGASNGIFVQATGGIVDLLKITDTWSCTNASGLVLGASGSGLINQVDCTSCVFSNNSQAGIYVGSSNVKNMTIIGCSVGQNNTSGIVVAGGCNSFKIIGNTVGASGQFTGNAVYGIVLAAGCYNFSISDNNLLGNGGGAISFGGTGSVPGAGYWITKNLGFVTKNIGVIVTDGTNSTFVVNHGLNFQPNLAEITASPNYNIGTTSIYLNNVSPTQFSINTSSVLAAGLYISWQAKSAGA